MTGGRISRLQRKQIAVATQGVVAEPCRRQQHSRRGEIGPLLAGSRIDVAGVNSRGLKEAVDQRFAQFMGDSPLRPFGALVGANEDRWPTGDECLPAAGLLGRIPNDGDPQLPGNENRVDRGIGDAGFRQQPCDLVVNFRDKSTSGLNEHVAVPDAGE
jgi:hypothetical protein